MARIRILLADDHTVMRRGLRLLLEQQADFQVIGEADDGRQAVDLAASLHPSVAVLDIGMPMLNGILIRLIRNTTTMGSDRVRWRVKSVLECRCRATKSGSLMRSRKD